MKAKHDSHLQKSDATHTVISLCSFYFGYLFIIESNYTVVVFCENWNFDTCKKVIRTKGLSSVKKKKKRKEKKIKENPQMKSLYHLVERVWKCECKQYSLSILWLVWYVHKSFDLKVYLASLPREKHLLLLLRKSFSFPLKIVKYYNENIEMVIERTNPGCQKAIKNTITSSNKKKLWWIIIARWDLMIW